MIEILSNGIFNHIQDTGRKGYLKFGVTPGGTMDLPALEIGNLLVGNESTMAGIEISMYPFKVKFHKETFFACTGAVTSMNLGGAVCPSWTGFRACAGDILTIHPPTKGLRSVLSVQGGIDVPLLLGSRSTEFKSGFGGLDGRGLQKADQLALGISDSPSKTCSMGAAPSSRIQFYEELASGTVRVRALAGAEYEHFTQEAQTHFTQSKYLLTPDCNRQGYRLKGPELKLKQHTEMLSHGVVPGTIQVPPSGQPMLQMVEANTLGGYPKIATIIESDIWRLAQLTPGNRIRFELIDFDQAVAAIRESRNEVANIQKGLKLAASVYKPDTNLNNQP